MTPSGIQTCAHGGRAVIVRLAGQTLSPHQVALQPGGYAEVTPESAAENPELQYDVTALRKASLRIAAEAAGYDHSLWASLSPP